MEDNALTGSWPGESLVLVLVGVGPRGSGLLERLVSNAQQDRRPIEVHLVDPFPPGGGRVWRDDQSGLLRLNTTTEDLTAFVDDSVALEGPLTPGPTLFEWCRTHGVDLDDPELATEASTVGSDHEQQREGDYLTKDERYGRTREYIQILKQAWTRHEPFDYEASTTGSPTSSPTSSPSSSRVRWSASGAPPTPRTASERARPASSASGGSRWPTPESRSSGYAERQPRRDGPGRRRSRSLSAPSSPRPRGRPGTRPTTS